MSLEHSLSPALFTNEFSPQTIEKLIDELKHHWRLDQPVEPTLYSYARQLAMVADALPVNKDALEDAAVETQTNPMDVAAAHMAKALKQFAEDEEERLSGMNLAQIYMIEGGYISYSFVASQLVDKLTTIVTLPPDEYPLFAQDPRFSSIVEQSEQNTALHLNTLDLLSKVQGQFLEKR
jgi:hypothetical protein